MTELIPDANTSDVIAEFLKTRRKPEEGKEDQYEEDYFQALVALRPDQLSIDQIAEIVRWVEKTKIAQPDYGHHVNIFGTGGDGTINVSSMAAIIASHFTRVVKVGTPGVTSLWGSYDFMEALRVFLEAQVSKNEPVHPFMKWGAESKYIALAELGFDYNSVLRKARKRLKEREDPIPDIYKVVFPFANYTNPQIQINGVSTKAYLEIYDRLAPRFNRPICIVDSEHDIDELMPGKNVIKGWLKGREFKFDWQFCESTKTKLWTLVGEKESAEKTVELFAAILAGLTMPEIHETIIHNAALIVACSRFTNPNAEELPGLLEVAYREVKRAMTHHL